MVATRSGAAGLLGAILALLMTGIAWAAPASDEYGARLPDAGGSGKGAVGGGEPITSEPQELTPSVRRQLDKSPDGGTLATIATADELAAPDPPPRELSSLDLDESDGRSLPAAAFDTLKSPLGLALLLGLAAITALIALAARSRRGEAGGPS
jgi:hypothetical protein